MLRRSHLMLLALSLLPVVTFAASPYSGQTSRDIKALSDQEVQDILSGNGMGLAKAAELNGYPGPAHVLDLAEQLQLSPTRRQHTEAIFERMQARAKSTGTRLIEEERKLDELFAAKAISPPTLHATLESIASLQREIREIHLAAHLDQATVLNADQIEKYWRLRGYANDNGGHKHVH